MSLSSVPGAQPQSECEKQSRVQTLSALQRSEAQSESKSHDSPMSPLLVLTVQAARFANAITKEIIIAFWKAPDKTDCPVNRLKMLLIISRSPVCGRGGRFLFCSR